MKALIIGATGYVGGAVARALSARGHEVHGLARSAESAARLREANIVPLACDDAGLAQAAAPFDILVVAVMLPFETEADFVAALLATFRGEGRTLLFTSGTGVLSIAAREGEWSEVSFAEDDPFPFPALYNREIRLRTETIVREASADGLRAMVIRPPLIYGRGGSVHIPQFFRSAEVHSRVLYLGLGLNLYSNVHIDDLAEVYALAVDKGAPGAVYHAVAGEADFRSIAEAVAGVVGCPAQSMAYDEFCALCGRDWVDMGLAVNSRSRAPRTREELGWAPRHLDLIGDIRRGSYHTAYGAGTGGAALGGAAPPALRA